MGRLFPLPNKLPIAVNPYYLVYLITFDATVLHSCENKVTKELTSTMLILETSRNPLIVILSHFQFAHKVSLENYLPENEVKFNYLTHARQKKIERKVYKVQSILSS